MVERIGAAGAQAAACPEQRRLAQAAADFEALLVAQLLKSGRTAGWMGTGEDQASASMIEMAKEHLAAVIASSGGLGLRDLLMEGLAATSCRGPSGTAEISPP